MFSDNISIWNWDGHTILDQKGNCINRAENIVIEDHVWIGMNASVSKGAKISKMYMTKKVCSNGGHKSLQQ